MKTKFGEKLFFRNFSGIFMMFLLVLMFGTGEKMAERFLPLYIISLGGSVWAIGLLNSMDNFLSAIYSLPGGWIAHRFGSKFALELFSVIALSGFLIAAIFPYWQIAFLGSLLFISWTAVSLPAIMKYISESVKNDQRSLGVSVHSFIRRIPMAVGPIIGGLFITRFGKVTGIRLAFGLAAIIGAIALFFLGRFMKTDKVYPEKSYSVSLKLKGYFNPALKILLASDIFIRFAEQIPYAFVVIWVVENNHVSPLLFGFLTMIEMIVAMIVYIPIAKMADKYGKKLFIIITFLFFTAFPIILMFSRSLPMFILAFIIRGLKEFGEPSRKALIMDLCPENARSLVFGTYYFIRDIIVSIAAFSGAWFWKINPGVNFMVASGFGFLGIILFAFFGKDIHSTDPLANGK